MHSDFEESPPRRQRWSRRKRGLMLGGWTVGFFVALAAAWMVLVAHPQIPRAMTEQVLFPTYLPSQLPQGYELVAGSFKVQDNVLLFDIRDEDGNVIHFAEESRPKSFDFTAFYQQQMGKTKNLQDVPYPSVIGNLTTGGMMLSITTDKTWLIIVGNRNSEDELRAIARRLRPSR